MANASDSIPYTIGTIQEQSTCTRIVPGGIEDLGNLPTNAPLILRFVIADDLEGHSFDVELRSAGIVVARRAATTSGIGRRSIVLPAINASRVMQLINRSAEPLFFESITPLQLQESKPPDFTMALLVDPVDSRLARQAHALDQLTTVPGIHKALGCELHFARLPLQKQREQLERMRSVCDVYGARAVISPCSWWAGTPKDVYEHPEFQQICWSNGETTKPTDALKHVMGETCDPHFGFTVPNMWANTPWQTMNNPELNKLRSERLKQSIPLIEQILKGRLAGYVSENEPGYWAWECNDYMYPVARAALWADFNPLTVADAKGDGLDLNPADGLDLRERMWLHANLGRYIQGNIDALNSCGPSAPVYSHALLEQQFPLQGTGHHRPYAECAHVQNARTGVELLRKANFDAVWRLREWGAWGCVNREENDGVDMHYHRGMLQLVYAMGANLFQSYNWESVNQNGRAIAYMNEFLASVASEQLMIGERDNGSLWKEIPPEREYSCPLVVSSTFPWANELSLALRAADSCTSAAVWLTPGIGGPVLAWTNIHKSDIQTTGPTRLDFGDMLHLQQDDPVTLHVLTYEPGWSVRSSADGPDFRLACDLRRARTISGSLLRNETHLSAGSKN